MKKGKQAVELSQGTVFPKVPWLPIIGARKCSCKASTESGVAIISHTCDALRSNNLQVCRVERCLPYEVRENAKKGRLTRFVHLPGFADDAFADLETVATVSKDWLSKQMPAGRALTPEEAGRLRQGIGRRFARVALPDPVVDWLKPLQEATKKQAGHNSRQLHWAFDKVRQIRVSSSSGWTGPTYSLELTLIMRDGVLPQFDGEDLPDTPITLKEWLLGKTPAAIENRLREICSTDGTSKPNESQTITIERYFLWAAFADTLVDLCRQNGVGSPTMVLDAEGRVASPDEFTLREVWDSEQLDLDHLSDVALTA